MRLTFHNVAVSINGTKILSNVWGEACPGEFLAIMGPSGGGKTTLLNTLAGRHPYQGEIRLDNKTLDKSSKRNICYVLQQEYFFGNLTLKETLEFTAMIRLPDEMSRQEKMARLDRIVEDLDLHTCIDTNMGDMFTPGLSGGEKKRANIACELLCDPQVIYLDEPTTGLDSSTASSLIDLLKTYATKSNKTIISSIHQPSSKVFFQFDKLLLLTDGQVAYFGSTSDVVRHFEAVGVTVRTDYNPADFIVEILGSNAEIKGKLLSATRNNEKDRASQDIGSSVLKEEASLSPIKHSTAWEKCCMRLTKKIPDSNHEYELEYSDMDPGSVHMSLLDLDETESRNSTNRKWPTGFCTQYTQLTIRTFKESRKRILNISKIVENLVICSFVCLMFFQLPRTEDTLRDRMGAVFFIAAHWGFIPLFDAVTSFPMERMVINKERSAGWYRLSAYYFAKMTSELVLILIQPTVFVVIAYWAIGLNGVAAFFSTLGTVFIDAIAGQSFGLFIGIACLQINQAMTVSITFQMGIMLLGGLFTRTLPVWLDWLKYLSFLHYSFHSLMVLEFTDAPPVISTDQRPLSLCHGPVSMVCTSCPSCFIDGIGNRGKGAMSYYKCKSPSNSSAFRICSETNNTRIPSTDILEYYDISWSYGQYIVPLLVFTIIFRTLGYLTLKYLRKPF